MTRSRGYKIASMVLASATIIILFQNCGGNYQFETEDDVSASSQEDIKLSSGVEVADVQPSSPVPVETVVPAPKPVVSRPVKPKPVAPVQPVKPTDIQDMPSGYFRLNCKDNLYDPVWSAERVNGEVRLMVSPGLESGGAVIPKVISHKWEQVSGPTQVVFSKGSSTAEVSNFTYGIYKFKFSITYASKIVSDGTITEVVSTSTPTCEKYVILTKTDQEHMLAYNIYIRPRL